MARKKRADGAWKIKKDKASLPCELTDDELIAKGEKLSKQEIELWAKQDEAKKSAKTFKTLIDAMQKIVEGLVAEIDTKKEYREVECEWRYGVPHESEKSLIRLDTFETVQIEAVQEWEKQQDIDDDPPPSEDGKEEI